MLEVCEGQFCALLAVSRAGAHHDVAGSRFHVLKRQTQWEQFCSLQMRPAPTMLTNGGYGAVMTRVSRDELSSLFRAGEMPGFSVALPDQGFRGFREPYKRIKHTRPFSRLPKAFCSRIADGSRSRPAGGQQRITSPLVKQGQ